ncbi:hypothetical protein BJY27_008613 [Streptomyces rapamycinicus]|uniref:Uncharacterized protein n=2 Tax=Streptomyces rapamycinicus TaxID=1226757 RepID=A0A3L8QX71_STRRN|nr:hypothetical protein [Streptomyces rapamycinicus]RLV71908.1 hypothetical protein D3C57_145315 [Streptomyces rapamycinicus NRRL 5491]
MTAGAAPARKTPGTPRGSTSVTAAPWPVAQGFRRPFQPISLIPAGKAGKRRLRRLPQEPRPMRPETPPPRMKRTPWESQ